MRGLAYIAVIVACIAGAILGPLAFSARTKEAPAAAPTGALVYRSGSYSVRLTEARCDHEELETMVLLDGGLGEAKAAVVTMGATQRAACWAFNAGGSVVARDYRATDRGQSEDVIPIDWFRRE